jgi:hypothetical protein
MLLLTRHHQGITRGCHTMLHVFHTMLLLRLRVLLLHTAAAAAGSVS